MGKYTVTEFAKTMTLVGAQNVLEDKIRRVHDFPQPGIVFEDLTPVLADPKSFAVLVDALAEQCQQAGAEIIGGLDARGFLLGSAVAYKLGLGILAIRKKGKLPPPVHSQDYSLEYGNAALEVPADGIDLEGKNIALVDDILATGGTLGAAKKLLAACGANVVANVVILEIPGLDGREKLGDDNLVVIYPNSAR